MGCGSGSLGGFLQVGARADNNMQNQLDKMWERIAKEDQAEKDRQQKMVDDAKADSRAVWMVADYFVPSDVQEFFERHGIGATGCEIWRSAFISGFRAALRGKISE